MLGYCSLRSQQERAGNFLLPSGRLNNSIVRVMLSRDTTIDSICTRTHTHTHTHINNNKNSSNKTKQNVETFLVNCSLLFNSRQGTLREFILPGFQLIATWVIIAMEMTPLPRAAHWSIDKASSVLTISKLNQSENRYTTATMTHIQEVGHNFRGMQIKVLHAIGKVLLLLI